MTAVSSGPAGAEPSALDVEQHTTEPIPLDERHGSARQLFGIWFGINMLPLTLVTGALATAALGLPFWSALLAILIGNVVGGIAMALHAAQGPRMGVPQMLQARAQFGFYGAALITVLAVIMYLGFFASNLVVGAQALHQALPGVSIDVGIVVAAALSVLVGVFGYNLLRRAMGAMAILVGLLTVVCFVVIAIRGLPAGTLSKGSYTAAGFFGMVAIAAVWQIAFAPYVSDYSRYMPAETGIRGAFWGTYLGCVLGAILLMTLGALAGIGAGENALVGLDALLGGFGVVAMLGMAAANGAMNAPNVYCGVLCTLTAGETVAARWRSGARSRVALTVIYGVAASVAAVLGKDNFLTNFENFILFLLYVLIPWSAINLVDYYLIRHGDYEVGELFRADGGRYGRLNWVALGVYVVGILVQLPFMVTSLYSGPLSDDLHDVDIAWIVGLVVSGGLYYAIARAGAGRAGDGVELTEPEAELVGR